MTSGAITAAIVQARTGSTRLPRKVLADLGGVPALARVLRRLKKAASLHRIVVATTGDPADDPVVELASDESCDVSRGHPTDVLGRYVTAAIEASPALIVRITADCPLLMPDVVDAVVEKTLEGGYDYASNTLTRTFPRGLDVECFTMAALERAADEATLPADREHVTPYMQRSPERFSLGEVRTEPDRSHLRWTLDYPEDLAFLDRVFTELPDPATLRDVVALMDRDAMVATLHREAVVRAQADD